MRLSTPRIPPSEAGDWEGEQKELMVKLEQGVGPVNVMRTMVRHPKLMKRWLPFTNHILLKSSLPARDREILILRTAWVTKSEYEWGQHVVIAGDAGMSQAEIDRVGEGAEAEGWAEHERTLIRATDELDADAFISDATWQGLNSHYSEQQVMDIIMTVGNYRALAGFINSAGVQLDAGLSGFPG
ncbi:MAG: carboxymuconolactone decarboxylase family protein [Alphaproteobacteria bacterium]|jgi:alkylhydroperoxidase family enzyme|nr:carboxymuconolactone decarboxylase family protein [Alphaproteobacteria bacterium]